MDRLIRVQRRTRALSAPELMSPCPSGGMGANDGREVSTAEKASKKRNTDSLSMNHRDGYYAADSQKRQYYLEAKARTPDAKISFKKARAAAENCWETHKAYKHEAAKFLSLETKKWGTVYMSISVVVDMEKAARAEGRHTMVGGMSTARRQGIHYLYDEVFGSPPIESCFGVGGVLHQIMSLLFIPEGSSAAVKKILEDCSTTK